MNVNSQKHQLEKASSELGASLIEMAIIAAITLVIIGLSFQLMNLLQNEALLGKPSTTNTTANPYFPTSSTGS